MTTRLDSILTFIRSFTTEHGYPPTIREIARGVGISIQTAYNRLDVLEAQRLVKADYGPNGYRRTRTIRAIG